VLALCRRLCPDPDDAYQDVWERILRRLHRYDPDRAELRTWILSVTHRHLIDRHRKRVVRRILVPLAREPASPLPNTDELIDDRRRRQALERAIQQLPAAQRRAVVLHHVHGQPLDAIASAERVALGTIKSRLHRGRERLSSLLGGEP
jgi:RNA polymerase sigma-70 factor (ECF subfamily)